MIISRRRSIGYVMATAVIGLGVGGTMVAYAEGPDQDGSLTLSDLKMPDGRGYMDITKTPWPKNEFGLTVGVPTEADRVAQNLPDLTPRKTDDGRDGFILAADLYKPDPKGPEQAAKQTRELLNGDGELVVKVYEPDGHTQIGTRVVASVTTD